MKHLAKAKNTAVEEEVEGLVNDVEVPETLPTNSNISINEIADIGYFEPPALLKASRERRGLPAYPMLKVVWRPLSYELDRNPDNEFQQREGAPFDCNIEWYTVYTNEGRWLSPNSAFGKFRDAVKEQSGVALTKNEVFRPLLRGAVFSCERFNDSYTRPNPDREDGKWAKLDEDGNVIVGEDGQIVLDEEAVKRNTRNNWLTFPVEKLDEYTPPATRRTQRVGYGGNIAEAQISAEQIEAIKAAMHGKSEDDYADALFESPDSDLIMTEPFMAEVADPARLTARLVKLGGKVLGGHIFFPELE